MRKLIFPLAVALAAALLALVGPRADAAPPSGTTTEAVVSLSTDVSSGTALVNTSSSNAHVFRGGVLRSSSAGTVEIRDGSASGTLLAAAYLEANVPLELPLEVFAPGARTTTGNELRVLGPATLTGFARYSTTNRTSTSADYLEAVSDSITTSAEIIAAVEGSAIRVKSMLLASDTAGVVVFTDGDGGSTLLSIYLPQDSSRVVPLELLGGGGGVATTSGNGLYAVLGSATITGTIRYTLE